MERVNAGTTARRPRMTVDREWELLDGALAVMREVGYEALTMDAVARRVKCSKATLYRQWSGKSELVTAAMRAAVPVAIDKIDTGSLRGDFVALVEQMAAGAREDAALLTAVAHASLVDPALGATIRETITDGERLRVAVLVDRAVDRGELRQHPAAAFFVAQMLAASVLTRPLFDGVFADAEYLTRFVDDFVLPALYRS